MSITTVGDDHVTDLYTSGGVIIRNALRYVFSKEDEELAVSAIAARLLDERAVCHVIGPTESIDCRSPSYPNGMVGISWTSPESCVHCDNQVESAADLPDYAAGVLRASYERSERFGPGDVLAFLCGPRRPFWTSSRVWVHAPAYFDESAAFIDPLFPARPPTPRAELINKFANAPFVSEEATCRLGPMCADQNTLCVCD